MDDAPRGNAEALVPVSSLEEFFRDSVDAALAVNHVVVERDTSHYVVQLLTLFSRSEAFYDAEDGPGQHRPLALMLAEAAQMTNPQERCMALRRMGDVALFTAGFFAEALHRRSVGLDYYINMGGGAYRALAGTTMAAARVRYLTDVFAELAAKFLDLVDVLNEVKASARGSCDQDVLRLYDSWLRTGSQRSRRLLCQAGVHPISAVPPRYQH